MPDRTITDLLSADAAALAARLQHDGFAERAMARLSRRARRRSLVLGAAAAAGALLASWQIVPLLSVPRLEFNDPSVLLLTATVLIAVTIAAFSWALAEG